MRTKRWRKTSSRRSGESGQALLFILLALGIFLVGAVGFAVDFGNMWFHKQSAQTAADAACTAGAMDLLVDATNGLTTQGGFSATKNGFFDCSANPTYAPCQYAALNGYTAALSCNSASTTPNSSSVCGNFPTTVPGVTAPTALLPANFPPFFRIDVIDRVPTFFSGLLSRRGSVNVRAFAVCGLVNATSPIPIIVLNPTVSHAVDVQGTPTVAILGGANRSIQVNSSSATAVNIGGTPGINLECGGIGFTGSALGVWGGPSTASSTTAGSCPGTPVPNTFPPKGGGFYPGTTGSWGPGSPVADPFALIPKPAVPPAPTVPIPGLTALNSTNCLTSLNIQNGQCHVTHLTHGCPDATNGCTLYTAGYYDKAISLSGAAITVGPGGGGITAIFDPGVYYLNGGLALQSGSMVRPGTGVGDGSGGTMFYLTGSPPTCSGETGGVCVGSNSGTKSIDVFNTSTVQCPGGTSLDPRLGVPPTLGGNILLAPCTGTYGDPLGQVRGILLFQDRSLAIGGGWGGGGSFLLAGSMYFHQCNATGTGTGCGPTPTDFNSTFSLYGNAGSTSYVLGEIISDKLNMHGTPTINMALNPNAAFNVLKVSMLQ